MSPHLNRPGPRTPGSRYSKYYYDGKMTRRKKKGKAPGAYCVTCGHEQYVPRCAWNRRCRPRCEECGGLLEPKAAL